MMMSIPRAAFGVFALLFTVATVDVSRARAQAMTVTPTVCGVGTVAHCGTEPILKCGNSFGIDFSLLMQSGSIRWSTEQCVAGTKAIYKDNKTPPTSGSSEPALQSCGQPGTQVGGGSHGSGLSGMRGSGDEDNDAPIAPCET